MLDQYTYVGPALFVLDNMPEWPKLVRYNATGKVVEPEEVWIEIHSTWLRLNGEWISGWRDGEHFGFRPHWWNRLKIRLAARRWRKRQTSTPTPSQEGQG